MVIGILFLAIAALCVLIYAEFLAQNRWLFWNLDVFRRLKQIRVAVRLRLCSCGCVLKSRKFANRTRGLVCEPQYLYLQNFKTLIFRDTIVCPRVGEFKLKFTLSTLSESKTITLGDFSKRGGVLNYTVRVGRFAVSLTVTSDFELVAQVVTAVPSAPQNNSTYSAHCSISGRLKMCSNSTLQPTITRAPHAASFQTSTPERRNAAAHYHNAAVTSASAIDQLNLAITLIACDVKLKHGKSHFLINDLVVFYSTNQSAIKEKTNRSIALSFSVAQVQKISLKLRFSVQSNTRTSQNRSPAFAVQFFATPRPHFSRLVNKLTAQTLTSFAHFAKVQKVCKQLHADYKNLVFFTLFNNADYNNYKKIAGAADFYNHFGISPVLFYKTAHPNPLGGVKFYDFYALPLNVANFLLSRVPTPAIFKCQSASSGQGEHFVDLATLDEYDFFACNACPDFFEFDNFRKLGNSLKLENAQEKVYFNFSSPFKIEEGKLQFRDAIICLVKSTKLRKKNYYECLVDKVRNDSYKTLFIHFWEDNARLLCDIDSAIAKCPAVSLIFALDKPNFLIAFESFVVKYSDVSSRLVSYYYLVKYIVQNGTSEAYLTHLKVDIINNICTCFNLCKKSLQNDQKYMIYLHATNMQRVKTFVEFSGLLSHIKSQLEGALPAVFQLPPQKYDDLISKFEPTLFNYEFLLENLLEIRSGCFRFKGDVCAYDNTFTLNYGAKTVRIYLNGSELKTIESDLKINANLFLPLNLKDVAANLQIY